MQQFTFNNHSVVGTEEYNVRHSTALGDNGDTTTVAENTNTSKLAQMMQPPHGGILSGTNIQMPTMLVHTNTN